MCESYRETQKERERHRKIQRDEQKERGGGPHTHPHTYLSNHLSRLFLRQHRAEHLDVAGVVNHRRRFVITRLSLRVFMNLTSARPLYLYDSHGVPRQTELK